MTCLKEVTVHQLVAWNITFLRSLNDWEEVDVLSLLALLVNIEVLFEVKMWPYHPNG